MGKQLDNERLQFFSRCFDSLARKLPREYEVPRPKSNNFWQLIYTPVDRVYFEWVFRKTAFWVALHFEKGDSEENRRLLDMFRPIERRLVVRLGEQVVFDDNWRRGETLWARLYVYKPEKEMTVDLEKWAVEKASILIHECEPLLERIPGYRRRHVLQGENSVGELPDQETFAEGAVCRVVVNRYERDPAARIACLNNLGYSCDVCEMNFLARYGEIGEGFIHVHHRSPLSLRKSEYELNPVTDLVPVCPNCHAMLHYGRRWDSPLSTDELREIMRKESGS